MTPEQAYHVRALHAEAQFLESQLAAKRQELAATIKGYGFDPATQQFVLVDGGQYPLGTVLDRSGRPLEEAKDG